MGDEETDEGEHSGRISDGEHLSGSSSFVARATVIRASRSVGNQAWSAEFGQWQIDAADAEHRRSEEGKDNALRRRMFWLVAALLVAILIVCGTVGIGHRDEETRRWAQNIVTTLIGGLLGAVAGYFTAKGGT